MFRNDKGIWFPETFLPENPVCVILVFRSQNEVKAINIGKTNMQNYTNLVCFFH